MQARDDFKATASTYIQQHNFAELFRMCDEAIRLDSTNSIAFNGRGIAYQGQGKLDLAINDFNEAIRLDPKFKVAYNNRGTIYQDQGKLELAINDFNEAIRLDPKYAMAYYNRGTVYKSQGKLELAINDFNEAMRLDPKFKVAYNNRGTIYQDQGKLELAINDFNEAIRLDPKFKAAYNNRGHAYRTQGKLDLAINDFNEAIRLDPKYAHAYYNRGTVYQDQGKLDLAINDFNEAIRLNPSLKPDTSFVKNFNEEKLHEIAKNYPALYHRAKDHLTLDQRLSACTMDGKEIDTPSAFIDILSQGLINEPRAGLMAACCGIVVDAGSVAPLQAHGFCPQCRKELTQNPSITPVTNFKSLIIEFVEKQEKLFFQPPQPTEEKAIANTLADAKDKEIAQLKQQLAELNKKNIELNEKYQEDEEVIKDLMKTYIVPSSPSSVSSLSHNHAQTPSSMSVSSTSTPEKSTTDRLREIHAKYYTDKCKSPVLFTQSPTVGDKSEAKQEMPHTPTESLSSSSKDSDEPTLVFV